MALATTHPTTKTAGTLNGDSLVSGVAGRLRSLITEPGSNVDSVYRTLAEIGISFGD